MEIKQGEGCVFWSGAKELGEERGFEMSAACPMEEYCETKCVFLSQEKLDEERVKQRLIELRKELGGLIGGDSFTYEL